MGPNQPRVNNKAKPLSVETLRNIINSVADPIFVKDRAHHWIMLNEAMVKFIGKPREELIGKSDYDVFPKEEADVFWGKDEEVFNSRETNINEEAFTDSSGKQHYISTKKSVFKDENGQDLLVGVIQDLTQVKETEMRVGGLLERLKSSNMELQQFAHIASHDLKEPIRMIHSFLDLLKKKYDNSLDEKAQKYIAHSLDGAVRMEAIVDDLRDFSQVTSETKTPVPINMNEAVNLALKHLHKTANESDAEIEFQDNLPRSFAIKNHIVRLYQNLLGNSIKYSSKERPLKISIGFEANNEGPVYFVKDNGIGISPEYQEQIFNLFKRLHQSEDYPGSGLGLSICKRIVERYNGKIWVESEPGQGSKFCFTLG